MRQIKWLPGEYVSEWQSCEDLGCALGTRGKTRNGKDTGRFMEGKESDVAEFGHPSFPVRFELSLGE